MLKLRWSKYGRNLKGCKKCKTNERPHCQHGLCERCFAKDRYKNNADYRKKHAELTRRWQEKNPERWKEIVNRAQKKYNAKKKNNKRKRGENL